MTQPSEISENDDTAPVAATTMTTELVGQVGTTSDPASSSFWTSPSTYLTIATYLLPILSTVFHHDFTQYAQALSELAPMVATGVLLLMRGQHKKAVIAANAAVQVARVHVRADASAHRRQLAHEARLRALEYATPTEKKAFVARHLAAA